MAEGRRRERILIVEDDLSVAKMVQFRLEAVGFEVHHEDHGCGALTDAAERRPDLVILDLMLPDMSGYEVCRELRKLYNRWDVPILMLTVMDRPVDELRGFAHGADAYLTKPYDPAELLKTITLLLGDKAPA